VAVAVDVGRLRRGSWTWTGCAGFREPAAPGIVSRLRRGS
jgi:hypothetical protein